MKNVKSFFFVNVRNSVFGQCKRNFPMVDIVDDIGCILKFLAKTMKDIKKAGKFLINLFFTLFQNSVKV